VPAIVFDDWVGFGFLKSSDHSGDHASFGVRISDDSDGATIIVDYDLHAVPNLVQYSMHVLGKFGLR
jgi:hypothetical protein